jgi:hypothetical protein
MIDDQQRQMPANSAVARTKGRAPAVRSEGVIALGATAVGALALGAIASRPRAA